MAETPEFRQWVEREFPPEASEWADPVSRRHFVKIIVTPLSANEDGIIPMRATPPTILAPKDKWGIENTKRRDEPFR